MSLDAYCTCIYSLNTHVHVHVGILWAGRDTTTVLAGNDTSILAPGEVSPGHMMFAPLKMNLIAPLSTCSLGSIIGSERKRERTERRGREGGRERERERKVVNEEICKTKRADLHLCRSLRVGM